MYDLGEVRKMAQLNIEEDIIQNIAFKEHMRDILEYRTMEYYRRRYEMKKN